MKGATTMANIIDSNAIDYNIPQDHAGQNWVESGSGFNADANFENFENHIPDDLGGTEGKAGTLTHTNFNDAQGVLDGEFSGPEREMLTDAGTNDVKHQKTNTHYSEKNPTEDVVGLAKKYKAAGKQHLYDKRVSGESLGKVGDTIFNSFLNTDAVQNQVMESTISGLRTMLVAMDDLRWKSDAMLGRKDRHGKFVYVDHIGYDMGDTIEYYYSLKPQYCVGQTVIKTMPPKSVLKVKTTRDN